MKGGKKCQPKLPNLNFLLVIISADLFKHYHGIDDIEANSCFNIWLRCSDLQL